MDWKPLSAILLHVSSLFLKPDTWHFLFQVLMAGVRDPSNFLSYRTESGCFFLLLVSICTEPRSLHLLTEKASETLSVCVHCRSQFDLFSSFCFRIQQPQHGKPGLRTNEKSNVPTEAAPLRGYVQWYSNSARLQQR